MIAGRDYRFSFEIDNPIVSVSAGTVEALPRGGFTTALPLGSASQWEAPDLHVHAESTAKSLFNLLGNVTMSSQIENNDASLNMCGHTINGDAAPLFIYKPRFTKAYISQNSGFPCTPNEISVSIATSVPLCAKDCRAQITISGLHGAVVQDGDIRLEASTDAGHEDDRDTFAAAIKGAKGYGKWADNSLTLFLTCCLECNKEYRFSFQVKNQNCQRAATDVYIESTNADSHVAIARIVMNTTQQQLLLGGKKTTLEIMQPEFTVQNIEQSSSAPCATNIITATVATNVPMDAGILITIKGITDSQTNSTQHMAITSALGASNVSCLNSTGSWNEDTGELVLQVAASTCYENSTWVDFAGQGCAEYLANATMCDTAAGRMQTAVNTTAHARFNEGGRSAKDECCACSWPRRGEVWGCAFSFEMLNPAKQSNGVEPLLESTICTNCTVINNQMHGKIMHVSPLDFDPYIYQSSSFPCDINKITVSLRHMEVPMLAVCNPSVTISSLTNAVHNDGVILVQDVVGGQTRNGTWNHGTIILRLSDFIATGAEQNTSLFVVSFDVINPNFAQVAPDVKIEAAIEDKRRTPPNVLTANHQTMAKRSMKQPRPTVYDFVTGQNGLPVPFQMPGNSSQLSGMVKNDSGVLQNGDIAAVDFTGKAYADWWFTCRNSDAAESCVKFADDSDDRKPLFVRPIFFIQKSIGQSNAEPCSHLTITVTLETSVPLLTRCNPLLTISGLTEAVELQAAVTNVSNEVNMSDFAINYLGVSDNISTPFVVDSFDREAGNVVLRVANSTMAGITYKVSFKLRHSAQQSEGVDPVLSMQYVASNNTNDRSQEDNLGINKVFGFMFPNYSPGSLALEAGPGDFKPMKVKALKYLAYAGQSSFNPCGTSTIWVKMDAINVKILHSCSPVVTISGLENAQTESGVLEVTNKDDNDAKVNGTFSKESSTLQLDLTTLFDSEAGVLAQNKTFDSFKTSFLFTFDLVNPSFPQSSQAPAVNAGISLGLDSQTIALNLARFSESYLRQQISNTSNLLSLEGATNYSLPLHVEELDFEIRRIQQSSPCAYRYIYVHIYVLVISNIYMYIYIYMYIHTYVYVYTYIYV